MVKLLTLDPGIVQLSVLSHINRDTINQYLKAMRIRIAEFCEVESPFNGEVEIYECYFEVKRVNGKYACGISGKIIVFGITHSTNHDPII